MVYLHVNDKPVIENKVNDRSSLLDTGSADNFNEYNILSESGFLRILFLF